MVVYSAILLCIGLAGVAILMVNVSYKNIAILLNFIANTFEMVALLGYFGYHFQW